jgi:hypothetical protein
VTGQPFGSFFNFSCSQCGLATGTLRGSFVTFSPNLKFSCTRLLF